MAPVYSPKYNRCMGLRSTRGWLMERFGTSSPADEAGPQDTLIRDLLGLSFEGFLSDVQEKVPWGPHGAAGRLDVPGMAAMADVDQVLTHADLTPADLQVFLGDEALENDGRLFNGRNRPNAAYVYERFLKGATVRVRHVQRFLPRAAGFADALSSALAVRVTANLYLTPGGCAGLKAHYDPYDVLVLQCMGGKRWRIYEDYAEAEPLPLKEVLPFDVARHVPGDVWKEFRMAPGDVLYMPRGVMHDAQAEEGDSLHLTFALRTLTVGDLMSRALKLAMTEDVALRCAVAGDVRSGSAGLDGSIASSIACALTANRRLERALDAWRRECRERKAASAHDLFSKHGGRTDGTNRLRGLIADQVRQIRSRREHRATRPAGGREGGP